VSSFSLSLQMELATGTMNSRRWLFDGLEVFVSQARLVLWEVKWVTPNSPLLPTLLPPRNSPEVKGHNDDEALPSSGN
jgi:hypothetical protein